MEVLKINTKYISDGVWEYIYEQTYPYSHSRKQNLYELFRELEQLTIQADYPTGSTSFTTCWNLYSIISSFKVKRVIEIGTYIGRSALTMAHAIDDTLGQGGVIYTCDYSNKIQLPKITTTEVIQYPDTNSCEMLKDLERCNIQKCDMAYIDGSLTSEDLLLLKKILCEKAILVFDDFQGATKGTHNVASVLLSKLFSDYFFFHPPSRNLRERFHLADHSSSALMIHADRFKWMS